jgi:Cof subfamily protein (haloacid dehalogenase superfamily)
LNLANVLFITDMDGTFLPDSKIPLDVDLKAVDDFKAAGGRFSFATGRILQASDRYLNMKIANAPAILSNGSTIYDPDSESIIWKEDLEKETVDIVLELAEKFTHVGIEIDTPDEIFVCRESEHETKHLEITGLTGKRSTILEAAKHDWVKVLFAGEPDEIHEMMLFEDIKKRDCAAFVYSSKHYFEILPKDCNKGSGLKRLRKDLGFADCFIIAMGDFYNDKEMLEAADYAVCPANAADGIKAIADYVCEKTSNEGAAAEILRILTSGGIEALPRKKID